MPIPAETAVQISYACRMVDRKVGNMKQKCVCNNNLVPFVDFVIRTSKDSANISHIFSIFVHIFWSGIYTDIFNTQPI